MKRYLIIISISTILLACNNNQNEKIDKSKLLGNDYRLFQSTPVWSLAKAVEDMDTTKIKELISKGSANVNYQESRFGNTLLMMAILNSQYESVKILLRLGADPNLANMYRGTTAMIEAADNENPEYIKLLLKYKGNPSAIETAPVKDGDMVRKTALNSAISFTQGSSLAKVKLLAEAGADINYFNNGNPAYTNLPLGEAFMQDKMEIVLYLLEQGADYKRAMYAAADEHEVYILEALRICFFDLNSPEYKKKMDIVSFLRKRGVEYVKQPIPDYILRDIKKKYPNGWQEYIKKY